MQTIVDFARDTLGVKLYPGQAEVLTEYYSSGRPNWLLLSGRRGGKSLLSDIVCCYECLVPDFSSYIRPGEQRHIIVTSQRQENANLHIQQIAKLLRNRREIGRLIKDEFQDRLILTNNVTVMSFPASARAARGFTCSTVLLDELAFFVDSLGNASGGVVFEAQAPTVATFGDAGRVVITTSVGAKTGIVYELYERAMAGELTDFHVTKKTSQEMNPKISERVIKSAQTRDAESASAEYFSEFRDPTESYLDGAALAACVDRALKEVERFDGQCVMAIDPATQRDRYAFAIMHRDAGTYVLDYAKALKPPVNPNTAEDLLKDLVRRFKPTTVLCDTASTVQRLKSEISALKYTPFTRPMKLRIYGSLKEAINLHQVRLYPHDDLLEELKYLQIRNGVDIAAPRAGRVTHDDLADCVALCVDALAAGAGSSWEMIPNFIYGDGPPMSEYIQVDGHWEHAPKANRKPHPPGVTWRNCLHRTDGCLACIREMEIDGVYEADKAAAALALAKHAGKPLTEQEALQEFLSSTSLPYKYDQERDNELRKQKVLDQFHRDVERNFKRD